MPTGGFLPGGLLFTGHAPTRRRRNWPTPASISSCRIASAIRSTRSVSTEAVVTTTPTTCCCGDSRCARQSRHRGRADAQATSSCPATTTAFSSPRSITDPNGNRAAVELRRAGMVVGTAVMGKRDEKPSGDLLRRFRRRPGRRCRCRSPGRSARRPHAHPAARDHPARLRSVRLPAHEAEPQPAPALSTPWRAKPTTPTWPPVSRPRFSTASPTRMASGARSRRRSRPSRVRCVDGRASDRQPALGRQRLDHLQQQGQAGSPVRAILHRHPWLRVRRPHRASARSCSTIPLERVVATLHPNHTWEKVVFDPWRQESWDVNDTVLDRRSRRTIRTSEISSGGCPRLSTCRPGMRSGRPERSAPRSRPRRKTAVHAETPTIAHADSLGRTVPDRRAQPVQAQRARPGDPSTEEFYRHARRSSTSKATSAR